MTIDHLKDYRVIIFGEMHTPEERDIIESWIRKGKFNTLVSEECGELFALTRGSIKQAIKEKHYSISDRSYKLGLELDLAVIGCDDWNPKTYSKDKKDPQGMYTDCKRSFSIRENRMAKVIKAASLNSVTFPTKRIAVIIGDSHLRERGNKIMGPRSILSIPETFGDDVLIVRSNNSEVK